MLLAERVAEASVQNAEELERDGIGDLRVDTDQRSITEVAKLVRVMAKDWPRLPTPTGPPEP